MLFGRLYFMSVLREEAGKEAAAAPAAVVAAVVASPAPAAAPAAPPAVTVDRKAIEAEVRAAARAETLKDLGFADEDAYKVHKDAARKAEEAKLSDAEKRDKALRETADAAAKAQARADEREAEVKQLRAEMAFRDLCDVQGVNPADRILAEALVAAEKKAKGKDYDEAKHFEALKASRPYLFAPPAAASPQMQAQASPWGTTSPAAPPPGSRTAVGDQPAFDAMKATPEQIRAWHASGGKSFS
jgi:hypothetical protein